MDFGRTQQAQPSIVPAAALYPDVFRALTARTGGDYVTPYVPGSGRVADWFVVRSGLESAVTPQPPDGAPDYRDSLPDPDYPIAAPLIYLSGEVDLSYVELNSYLFADVLAAALPGSKLQNKDLNSWLRLYTVHGGTHQPREAWFAGPANGGNSTWYEFGGAGLNDDGRGLELPAWMDSLRAANPDLLGDVPGTLDNIPLFDANLLSEEGLSLQAIVNADRWARTGIAPPTSAVDGSLVTNPSTSTAWPNYPTAESCTPAAVFGAKDFSCLQTLGADSVINDPNAGFHTLDEFEVSLMQQFAASGLRYTTTPIDVPGEAVPLGFRLLTPGPALERPFTTAELKARYHTHGGYVAAVTRAVATLVARGLYDPAIGAMEIAAAARSDVLR
jgi:hypothetical protein